MRVAIVHDSLTHLAGGERVVLGLAHAFPGAVVYTSLFEQTAEFPEIAALNVRTSYLNRVSVLRRHHRWALPALAPTFSSMRIEADVVICSSAGWSHGVRVRPPARKIVYCHTPARWLYQRDRYLGPGNMLWRAGLSLFGHALIRWDKRAAASADRYIANSRAVRDRIRTCYGIDADVVPPPLVMSGRNSRSPAGRFEPGYVLCVSRLLPYKNVEQVVNAVSITGDRLVVVGRGPMERSVKARATELVTFVDTVSDEELRWLYENCAGLVAASYEDFGLTVTEAQSCGKPVAALRWGGYLDSVEEGRTGVFFDAPTPSAIADAISLLRAKRWDSATIRDVTEQRFGERNFVARIRAIVDEELHRDH